MKVLDNVKSVLILDLLREHNHSAHSPRRYPAPTCQMFTLSWIIGFISSISFKIQCLLLLGRLEEEGLGMVAAGAVQGRAWNEGYPKVREDFTITEKAPTFIVPCLIGVINVQALVGAFNQVKALVGAFSVIVKSLGTFG